MENFPMRKQKYFQAQLQILAIKIKKVYRVERSKKKKLDLAALEDVADMGAIPRVLDVWNLRDVADELAGPGRESLAAYPRFALPI